MFRLDKPAGRLLSGLMDQLLLTILTLLCSLPLITAGAAAIALYEQEYALLEQRENSLLRDYFKSFARNFVKGLVLLLLTLFLVLVGLGIWSAFLLVGLSPRLMAFIVAMVIGGVCCWLLGLTGRFEQKMGTTFQNAYLLAIRFLPQTLALSLVNVGMPALLLVMPQELFGGYSFFMMFLFPGLAARHSCRLLLKTLEKLPADSQ